MICVLGTLYPFQSTTNWPSSPPASSRSDMWKLIRTHLKLSKSFKEINEWSPVNSPAHIHCTGAWQDALRNRIVFTMHWIKIILNDWATSVNFARSSGRGEWPFNLNKFSLSKRPWIQKWEPKIYSGDLMLFLNKLNRCPWSVNTFTSLLSSVMTMWVIPCRAGLYFPLKTQAIDDSRSSKQYKALLQLQRTISDGALQQKVL